MNLNHIQRTKADFDNVNWHTVVDNLSVKSCINYGPAFLTKAAEAREVQNNQSADVYELLGHACSALLQPEISDSPLGRVPYDFEDSHLQVLQEIIPEIKDGELLARISDIIFLGKEKFDYQVAQSAVRGYLEASKQVVANEIEIVDRLQRGLQIASRLGKDKPPYADLIKHVETLYDSYYASDSFVLTWHLSELLYNAKSPNIEKYIDGTKHLAEVAELQSNWYFASLIWSSVAQWSRRDGNHDEEKKAVIRTAEIEVTQAEISAKNKNYIAASAFIGRAITIYRQIGGEDSRDRVEELKTILLDYEEKSLTNLSHVSGSVPTHIARLINQAQQDATKKVSNLDFFDALLWLAVLGKSPKKSELREMAKESISSHVFLHMVNRRYLDSEGKVKGLGEEIYEFNNPHEEAIKEEMLTQAIMSRSIIVLTTIAPALTKIRQEHQGRYEDFFNFVRHSPFIPPHRASIIAHGLMLGFKGDLLLSAHLLLPQLEYTLRYILQLAGYVTSGLNDDLTQPDYLLGKLLYMEELKGLLGENTLFDLQGLLVEQIGSNLRNKVAHGLLNPEEFDNEQFIYLWWMVIHLTGVFFLDRIESEKENEKIDKN